MDMVLDREFRFKTHPEIFWKERDDVKNNTVREIDLSDDRFTQLIAWSELGWNDGEIQIIIQCGQNPKEYCIKEIRDITLWNGLMVITWNEDKKKE